MQDKEYYKQYYQQHRERYIERARQRYALHKEEKREYDKARRLLRGDELRAYDRQRYQETRRYTGAYMLSRARQRARRYGIPFNITMEDIVIPDTCPVLQIPLAIHDKRGGRFDSPSLDRIVPELGYVKGNVVVISKRANLIKTDASVDEIESLAKWLRSLLARNADIPSS